MLSADEAKEIGINACIEKLGIEFCKKHSDRNGGSGGYRWMQLLADLFQDRFADAETDHSNHHDHQCALGLE